jgi:PAS domain S-box-containing protein
MNNIVMDILLIRNDGANAEELIKILKNCYRDFNIESVNSFEEIQKYLAINSPDIIILSKGTCVQQTWTALEAVRFSCHSIPFILFSHEIDEEFFIEGIKRGASDYLTSSDFNKIGIKLRSAVLREKTDSDRSGGLNTGRNNFISANPPEISTASFSSGEKKEQGRTVFDSSSDSFEQFRSVIESVSEVIFQTDFEGKLIYLNPFWEHLTGFTCEESCGEIFLKYFHKDDIRSILNSFISLLYRKSSVIKTERRIATKDGQIRWIQINARLSFDSENQLVGMSGTIRDIHESKLAKEELILAKSKAEESDRLKSFFLAQMSHEIRTPLNVMLSYSSFIQEELKLTGTTNDLIEEGFQCIGESGKRLVRTMDLILNMALINTGQFNISPAKTNIVKIISNIIDDFQTYAAKKKLKINFENKCIAGYAFADEYTLTNAFYNIIDNSLKYTDKGGINIIVSNGGPSLMIEINDTGIGISKEYLDNMFEPFSQEDSGYTRKFDGSGLGLALTKKYIELNKGEIFVDSKKGIGTTFKITLKCLDNMEMKNDEQ